MAINVSELEVQFFSRDLTYQNVRLKFLDEIIIVPELKVVYVVDYIGNDKYAGKYKVGIHFNKMDHMTDDKLGKKINSLLREIDFNLDFEKFVK